MAAYGKGIDNAHVDVYLCAALQEQVRETVRNLLLENLRIPASGRRSADQLVGVQELESFRERYLSTFETVIEHSRALFSPELPALFQIALLKLLLQSVLEENLSLQKELKRASNRQESIELGHSLEFHESLVALTRNGKLLHRRVLRLLLRQMRKLEKTSRLRKLRNTLGREWPLPKAAIFNPILTIPDLEDIVDLGQDYPAALLAGRHNLDWLYQTNQCITKVFQQYLPPWVQMTADLKGKNEQVRERLDQGQLQGFLTTEMTLRRFVPEEEYRLGRCSWLDDPENLQLFLRSTESSADSVFADSTFNEGLSQRGGYWEDPRWGAFQRAISAELYRCLNFQGLAQPVSLLYRLSNLRTPAGRPIPLEPILDFVEGKLSRDKLQRRLKRLRMGMEGDSLRRLIDNALTEVKRLPSSELGPDLDRYLVDFLKLRRDLKLAYKAYEVMDAIRLLEDEEEVQLSRSNGTLIEFGCREESGPLVRKILGHTVIKADVRGSTRITEELRARGLNPASHFSLNFFDPVNRLLPEYGAEKLFVEGDAVILVLFEYEDDQESQRLSVARACGLSRKILQVVSLQNIHNRKHGLPPLELGLGIAYARGEPNFLYDEGRRIMISNAINRADRLSSCSSELKRGGFVPQNPAFRVTVVSDTRVAERAATDEDLLAYNVNGVKIDQDAFFKLQKEVRLRQICLSDPEFEDTLFFVGIYADRTARRHWLILRYGPVFGWDGRSLGEIDPKRRHFFEVIVDEKLSARLRRLIREQEAASEMPASPRSVSLSEQGR